MLSLLHIPNTKTTARQISLKRRYRTVSRGRARHPYPCDRTDSRNNPEEPEEKKHIDVYTMRRHSGQQTQWDEKQTTVRNLSTSTKEMLCNLLTFYQIFYQNFLKFFVPRQAVLPPTTTELDDNERMEDNFFLEERIKQSHKTPRNFFCRQCHPPPQESSTTARTKILRKA